MLRAAASQIGGGYPGTFTTVRVDNGTTAAPSIGPTGSTSSGWWFSGGQTFYSYIGQTQVGFGASSFQFSSNTELGWSPSTPDIAAPDLKLVRDAANILAQRNGTAAQASRLYNTFTNASNFESGGFDWITTANTLRIRSENAGTGVNRIIAIDGFAKAGAAVAGDIPSGTWALVRDTSGATTKLVYNNAGTLMSVALV